jgi:hypothetical protein
MPVNVILFVLILRSYEENGIGNQIGLIIDAFNTTMVAI